MKPQFKGTPGPWKIGKYPDNDVVFGPDGHGVAWIEDTTASGEEEANTRLIAAAPEQLEALQKTNDLLKYLDNTHTGDSRYADFAIQYSENRKLIEKALEG
jgi:hypothetical protein